VGSLQLLAIVIIVKFMELVAAVIVMQAIIIVTIASFVQLLVLPFLHPPLVWQVA